MQERVVEARRGSSEQEVLDEIISEQFFAYFAALCLCCSSSRPSQK